jgi:hypothetical protein
MKKEAAIAINIRPDITGKRRISLSFLMTPKLSFVSCQPLLILPMFPPSDSEG